MSTTATKTNERAATLHANLTFVGTFLVAFLFNSASSAPNETNDLTSATPSISSSATALENAFFDLLWRCDSPLLVERNDAEDELTRRFAEFEPIWQNRDFLTNGEISTEASFRFESAEARFRADVERQTLDGFRTRWDVGAIETKDGAATRTCNVQIARPVASRIVYLAPDWRAFFWRDPTDGSVWRPRERFSSPEIAPDFNATTLEIIETLERVDDVASDETPENGAFDVLLGADARDFVVPFGAFDDASNVEVDADAPRDPIMQTLRSGDLTLVVAPARLQKNGETTAFLRLEFAKAFDAFDSHRVWFDRDDFAAAFAENDGDGENWRIVAPIRLRTRSRNVRGVSIELDFPATATDALKNVAKNGGGATLRCRLPRFFLSARLPFRADAPDVR